ncbi:MAG: hypothetical protein ACR2KK_14055 [Acidimicrobiales bacterium]
MLDDIVDVYSQYTARDQAVHAADEYRLLCDKYGRIPGFDALRSRTEDDKKKLEAQLADRPPAEQVKLALISVRQRRSPEPGPVTEAQYGYIELARKSYENSWTPSQREYFVTWSDRLLQSLDFFLSFTNRNPTPDYPNIVNKNHEFFIRNFIHDWRTSDRSKDNLLARTIYYLLRSGSLTGFYLPEHRAGSYEIIPKLKEECLRAFVFIQLVQGTMFINAPSYCGLEYKTADEAVPSKPRVLIDADDTLPTRDAVHQDLLEWYESVQSTARTKLAQTADLRYPKVIEANHKMVKDKVIEFVRQATRAAYENVPAV